MKILRPHCNFKTTREALNVCRILQLCFSEYSDKSVPVIFSAQFELLQIESTVGMVGFLSSCTQLKDFQRHLYSVSFALVLEAYTSLRIKRNNLEIKVSPVVFILNPNSNSMHIGFRLDTVATLKPPPGHPTATNFQTIHDKLGSLKLAQTPD